MYLIDLLDWCNKIRRRRPCEPKTYQETIPEKVLFWISSPGIYDHGTPMRDSILKTFFSSPYKTTMNRSIWIKSFNKMISVKNLLCSHKFKHPRPFGTGGNKVTRENKFVGTIKDYRRDLWHFEASSLWQKLYPFVIQSDCYLILPTINTCTAESNDVEN